MAEKLITVFGATGRQGNSVALALLASGGYRVRALTCNPEGSGAKALQEKGCEVMKVDMDDKASLEAAIAGSYGVFATTNYWALLGENPETAFDRVVTQGRNIGDICKNRGTKHLLYSGLEHIEAIIGKPCPPFDSKALVEKYLNEIQVPHTSIHVSYYYDNFIRYPAQKNADGTYSMTWPLDSPLDAVNPSDIGPAVVSILNSPEQFIGKTVGISGDRMAMSEYAAIISQSTGKTVTYNQVSLEDFAAFPFPGADVIATMFEFNNKVQLNRNAEFTRTLNPNMARFKDWAVKNKDKLLPV